MPKIHLIKNTTSGTYSIIKVPESGTTDKDCISEDILQADSISELLHKIQDTGDTKYYCGTDFIDSKHRTRKEMYPLHCEIHVLPGFIKEICDIRQERLYTAEWSVRFVSDLWILTDEYSMSKVRGFTEEARREAEEYIKKHNLQYEEDTENEQPV